EIPLGGASALLRVRLDEGDHMIQVAPIRRHRAARMPAGPVAEPDPPCQPPGYGVAQLGTPVGPGPAGEHRLERGSPRPVEQLGERGERGLARATEEHLGLTVAGEDDGDVW